VISKFDELTTEATGNVNYHNITYAYPRADLPDNLKVLAQKVSIFSEIWKRQILLYLGPLQNTNLMRLFWIFHLEECKTVLLTYPGQSFVFDSTVC
jgi:hypothetical protein